MMMVDDDAPDCRHDEPSAISPPLEPELVERASALFRALGDPARLRLLHRLAEAGEACVSELQDEGEGMSTVSQRLKLLRGERLVSRERRGKHVYYRLADEHVMAIVRDALDHVREVPPPT